MGKTIAHNFLFFWDTLVSTSRLKPCIRGATIPMAAPPRKQPAAAAPPKLVCYNLAPTPPPAAADPGTIFFPGKPARFFAHPGEASSSRPATQPQATHLATRLHLLRCDQEAGGSSVGTLCPCSHHEFESAVWHTVLHDLSRTSSLSCVYSSHNVQMYTLNKVSILLLLVLNRFRRTSERDLIPGPEQSFVLVHFLQWLFFSWSKIFSFPFIKHAFSYHTVFNSFFEEKSNIFMLGYRSAEKTGMKALWRREENCPGNLKSINSGR